MMAFFLLLWILGATTEKQRKGIADYFTPTLVEMRQKSAGSNGPFGGDSIIAKDNYPHKPQQTGTKSLTIPKDTTGGAKEGASALRSSDKARMQQMKQKLMERMKADPKLAKLQKNIRFTETREGLRIDLVDEADFSMFSLGTANLLPDARALIGEVANLVTSTPNAVIIRGHTDALPYAKGRVANNWTLSTFRAEVTRQALMEHGVPIDQFARIEGVADREPYVPDNTYDPRNRRMSITLAWEANPNEAEQLRQDIGASLHPDSALPPH
jgi:chemotaxis protein MotB